MSLPEWMKPSPALKRMAEAKEPEILAMTDAEKRRVVLEGSINADEQSRLDADGGEPDVSG